jgi:hypothetical protein
MQERMIPDIECALPPSVEKVGTYTFILKMWPVPPSMFTSLAFLLKAQFQILWVAHTPTCSLLVFLTDNATIVWPWVHSQAGPSLPVAQGPRPAQPCCKLE